MRLYFLLMIGWFILPSCQKELHELTPPALHDSTATAQPGQLIGMKIYYLTGTDTLPADYYEFKYDSNPKRLIEYHHMSDPFANVFYSNIDTADKIWTYDNNGLLITQAGFYKGISNITYINKINRGANGELKNFDYQNIYSKLNCTTSQFYTVTEQAHSIFSQTQNGTKVIHYIDTLSGVDESGTTECDYSVYFDAAGRVQMKILNGMRLPGPGGCKFIYFPIHDTVKQFFYDPLSGRVLKSIITHYAGALGSTPDEMEKTIYTATYTYDVRDNQKIARFFQQYTWGNDLQSWFSYQVQSVGSLGGGVDDDYFQPEFEHLKYGVCTKMSFTREAFLHQVSEGAVTYEYVFNSGYDVQGNLVHYSIQNPVYAYYFEFLYKYGIVVN